jgi:hypothetical protein
MRQPMDVGFGRSVKPPVAARAALLAGMSGWVSISAPICEICG